MKTKKYKTICLQNTIEKSVQKNMKTVLYFLQGGFSFLYKNIVKYVIIFSTNKTTHTGR